MLYGGGRFHEKASIVKMWEDIFYTSPQGELSFNGNILFEKQQHPFTNK